MAKKSRPEGVDKTKDESLIDPIYQKFVRSVNRAIGSTEFYHFFMDSISRAQNEFQFTNRKLIKSVDLKWIDLIEDALDSVQTIIASPRNVIKEEELIVNVANARKAGAETIRHLAQHSSLVENFDEARGEVRPGRLMQRYREDSVGLYENQLVYSTLEYAYHFVKIRHDALFAAMSEEYGARLRFTSEMESDTEQVHLDMNLHINKIDSAIETDKKNEDDFTRISRIYRMLSVFMSSGFAQQMADLPRLRNAAVKTNVLKRNPAYHKVMLLWDFLRQYEDIGYSIRVEEQSLELSEQIQQDVYLGALFQYLILKGNLEDPEDRLIPAKPKGRQRTFKPKFIHQIVEELTEDYNLPDVEIRKVLIEELTREQLMQEEAAERRRLVEEQAKRKKEEEDRIRAEKKAEQERLKAERAAERERIRQEKEVERARRELERREREAKEQRLCDLYREELSRFGEMLPEQLALRQQERDRVEIELLDFADAVILMEEEEERRRQEVERERVRRLEEAERLKREQEEAQERERQEKLAREEAERLAREAEEARIAQEQRQQALILAAPLLSELEYFEQTRNRQQTQRKAYTDELRRRRESHDARLRERRAQKQPNP